MACKDCDRFPDCKYKINSPTWGDLARGTERYIRGEDCPKKWQYRKVEDMTEEQCREAVKELRKKLLSTIESKSTEENMARTRLFTDKEIREAIKEDRDEVKPIYEKSPLGCKPAQLVCTDRIKVVADAISRYADSPKFNSQLVRRWATEIGLQCDIFERC